MAKATSMASSCAFNSIIQVLYIVVDIPTGIRGEGGQLTTVHR